jgi:hypothetical protein
MNIRQRHGKNANLSRAAGLFVASDPFAAKQIRTGAFCRRGVGSHKGAK